MASNTYTLISSNVLGSSAASVTFSSIPATYTDLVLRVSARTNTATALASARFTLNGLATAIYSYTQINASGTTVTSNRASGGTEIDIYLDGNTATASTFGSSEFYIPNYQSAVKKPIGSFSVTENNSGTINDISPKASLVDLTSAVTSVGFVLPGVEVFVTGSSFYLYGIKNS